MNSFVRRSLLSVVLSALVTAQVLAQDTSGRQEVRPAVTSFWGDTGLWFIPTAEVLRPGGWAFGAYRTELDFKQGSTDVVYYPGTLAVGAGSRYGDLWRGSRRHVHRSRYPPTLCARQHANRRRRQRVSVRSRKMVGQ